MRFLTGIIVIVILCACGCSSRPTNGTSNLNQPIPTAVFTPGGLGLFDGEPAQLNVTVTNGTPPYTIWINMGGGADNVPAGTTIDAVSNHDFTLTEGGPYSYTVTVMDGYGETGTTTGSYGPIGPPQNHAPMITDIAFDGGVLAVMVDDPDGDDPLTVSVSEVPGLIPNTLSQQVANKSTALFTYKLLEGFNAVDLAVTASVSDGVLTGNATAAPDGSNPPVTIPDGALVAIPLKTRVAVGEPVRIVVMSGDFPEDAPMMAVFTAISGIEYADHDFDSIDPGAVGGGWDQVDGIWAGMEPKPSAMLPIFEFFYNEGNLGSANWINGLIFYPEGGAGAVTQGGALYNLEVTFDTAGVHRLGFVLRDGMSSTFYRTAEWEDYVWSDTMNNHPGLPNTITVE